MLKGPLFFIIIFYCSFLQANANQVNIKGENKKTEICISGIYTPGKTTGHHASIYVKQEGVLIKSYGYFPEEVELDGFEVKKIPNSSLKIDGDHDRPYTVSELRSLEKELDYSKNTYRSFNMCQTVLPDKVAELDRLARNYEEKYGPWTGLRNNCLVFATRLYNATTNDFIPTMLINPTIAGELINGLQAAGFNRYVDYNNFLLQNQSETARRTSSGEVIK